MKIFKLFLQLFANETTLNANTTNQTSMSDTMKTFYDTALLENAREALVFNQFAEKQRIHGNKVEWRKFNTFPKAMTPITEGVTPTGSSFGMTKIEADTTQHGDYTTITDRLEYEATDPIIMGATEEMGAAGGATMDTLTRDNIICGNCVQYCPSIAEDGTETEVLFRKDLDSTCLFTPAIANKAATFLKKTKTPKNKGSFIALIHPSVAHDLRESKEWKEFHKYNDTAPIWDGEIGKMHNIRFVESNECKIHAPAVISGTANRLQVTEAVTSGTTVKATALDDNTIEAVTKSIAVYVKGVENTITTITVSDGVATITLSNAVSVAVGDMICGQGAGKDGSCTYDTLVFGAKAYGVVEPENESMKMIIKDKSVIGGPLELYSTIGYKFSHGAKILYQERILRIESGSSFSFEDTEN